MNLKKFFKNHVPDDSKVKVISDQKESVDSSSVETSTPIVVRPINGNAVAQAQVAPSENWLNAETETITVSNPMMEISPPELLYQNFLAELIQSNIGSFTADQISDLFEIYKQEGTLTQTKVAAVLTRQVEDQTIKLNPVQVIPSDPIFPPPPEPKQKPLPQGLAQYEGYPRTHAPCRVVDEFTRQRTECPGTEAIKISGGQLSNGTHRLQMICTTCGRGFTIGY